MAEEWKAEMPAVFTMCIRLDGSTVAETEAHSVECVRELVTRANEELAKLRAERDEAQMNYEFTVQRAADKHLEGYRELGARAASAENQLQEYRLKVALAVGRYFGAEGHQCAPASDDDVLEGIRLMAREEAKVPDLESRIAELKSDLENANRNAETKDAVVDALSVLSKEQESRIADLEAAQRWRPMSEAPKDGTRFLLRHQGPYSNKLETSQVLWLSVYDWKVEGFARVGGGMISGKHMAWMPLPEPPKEELFRKEFVMVAGNTSDAFLPEELPTKEKE